MPPTERQADGRPIEANTAYADAGIDYSPLDHFKRMAQEVAGTTEGVFELFGFSGVPESRGESAYVFNMGFGFGALVQEGLGTKSLVAEAMSRMFPDNARTPVIDQTDWARPQSYFEAISWDTASMIINDLITVGAAPVVLCPHWTSGSSDWFSDQDKSSGLYRGWLKACSAANAVYGPGETAVLPGVIMPESIELSGSGFGIITPPERLTLGDNISVGDKIVLVESSGIHANGVSLARKIATENLKRGYETKLSDGRLFGDVLLTPTHIYAKFHREMSNRGVDVHYAVHITGHGWRKLMRANMYVTHRMHTLPNPQEEFQLMQRARELDDSDMYATFNMGAGFAVWVRPNQVTDVQEVAGKMGLQSWDAGVVEEGPKQVVIKPKGIIFSQESLQIR